MIGDGTTLESQKEEKRLGTSTPIPSSSGADYLWYTQYDLYGAGFDVPY